MTDYLLKSSILLAVLYLIYQTLLRKETFFRMNRIYLIAAVWVSVILPLLPAIHIGGVQPAIGRVLEEIAVTTNGLVTPNQEKPDLINPAMIIYISGTCWFFLRLISSIGKLAYLYHRFPHTTTQGYRTVVIEGDHAPFTFFNILFIGNGQEPGSGRDSIIEHELAHLHQWHSVDLILIEVICVVFWFNPFIWLLKRAVKTEHEYAADRAVLEKGYNALDYQQQLFETTMGVSVVGLVNNLNYSLLKNRMKMMTKNRSGRNARFKYFLVLPLVGVLVCGSLLDTDAGPGLTLTIDSSDSIYFKVDVMPEFEGGIEQVRVFIAENLMYPELAIEKQVEGKVFVEFVVDKTGKVGDIELITSRMLVPGKEGMQKINFLRGEERSSSEYTDAILSLEEEALRVVGTIPDFTSPGYQNGKPVRVQYTFPIFFSLQEDTAAK